MFWVWVAFGAMAILFAGALIWGAGQLRRARAQFRSQRATLEAAYFRAAAASGKPRGLRWKACEWGPALAFAREKGTGQLAALAEVILQFEGIEGGDMEGLPAVGNLRNASAVFFFHRGSWHTTGKTIFNLNPGEVLTHFAQVYDPLPDN